MMTLTWLMLIGGLLVATLLPVNADESLCGEGWDQQGSSTCLFFQKKEMNREDARKSCQAMGEGVDLASFHSQEDFDFVKKKAYKGAGSYVWTGLKDASETRSTGKNAKRDWQWSDGTPYDFNAWASHVDPNNYNGYEWCVVFVSFEKYKWYDTNCGDRLPSLCKKTLENPCGEGWDYAGDKCFMLQSEEKNYEEAEASCKAAGGRLASITSPTYHGFVKNHYKPENKAIYIGLKDYSDTTEYGQQAVRDWKWSDGTPFNYKAWVDATEPNNVWGKEKCVTMQQDHDYRWYDVQCTTKAASVCGKAKPPPFTCGRLGVKTEVERIVGGKDTPANKHPWAVALKIKHNLGPSQCSGTLIHNEWIVSTAQCFVTGLKIYDMEFNLESVQATIGKDDLSAEDDSAIVVDIPLENIKRHDDFMDGETQNLDNNIVLLKLPEPITYSESIQPICLPQYMEDTEFFSKESLTMVGWGSGARTNVLQEASADIVDLEECKKSFPGIDENVMCLKKEGVSMCMGDGGGTVEFESEIGTTLVGMNAFSKMEFDGSCLPGNAGGAMYIPRFMKWITDTTGLPLA